MINDGPAISENTFWIEVIIISVGISIIAIVCVFCFCSQIDNEHDDYDDANKHLKHNRNQKKKNKKNGGQFKTSNKGEHGDMTPKRKERILSDTENYSDNEDDQDTNTGIPTKGHEILEHSITRFKQSLSIQIQNQEKLMDEVMKQMRRDSQHGLGLDMDNTEDCKYDNNDNDNKHKFEVNIMKEDLNKLKVENTLEEEPEEPDGSETDDAESIIESSLKKASAIKEESVVYNV
eukprot:CAMPEP_0201592630 /NCGR_PEP_ID=MMETSP0190_2-20130828/190476_1 /ASSEMBLY_ACC=CAM_ASM_000263 /TAXON_ID=37353 /ORGANISM="Rosalina sp." /LENGTH=233 /DNA_ID=CAMNT_0048051495 /DNA_START=832 /DNA_END=1533 /DNA_ORIENTATION=-